MADLLDLIDDLNKHEQALRKLDIDLPMIIGVECTKQIRNNFKIQGYYSPGAWKRRSNVTNMLYDYNRTSAYRTPVLGKVSKHRNPYKGSVINSKRPILTQTGNLRDSVTYKIMGHGVEIGVFTRTVMVDGKAQDSLSYAKIHNEGLNFKMFGKTERTMPRRQFMPRPDQGPSEQMLTAINAKYKQKLDYILWHWK